jgi:hypothetical protein
MAEPTMSSHDDNPESKLPLNPTVTTQEEEEERRETKEDTVDATSSMMAQQPPPKKRRRSLRNTNVSKSEVPEAWTGLEFIYIYIVHSN